MYHLTSKKYWFFGVSLLIIIPGIIFLMLWGLNPGIDFTGGTTVDLHFQNALASNTSADIEKTFQDGTKARDVKVYYSTQPSLNGSTIYWVQLSTSVDKTVQDEVLKRLNDAKTTLGFNSVAPLPPLVEASTDGGKTTYSLLPFQFDVPLTADNKPAINITPDQITQALTATPLPNTGPAQVSIGAATPTTTAATAAPTATTDPSATATAAPTATPVPTTPVTLTKVYQGTTNQIVTVQVSDDLVSPATLQSVESTLLAKYGPIYQSQAQTISASIGRSTTVLSIIAVAVASLFILFYVAYAFRNVGKLSQSVKYGACAVIALLHDALVLLGVWALLGHLFPNEFKVDTLFVTAVLTVIGFSVHDTIVVFDRIRENVQRRTSETFVEVVNASLLQTMARSLNTSLTVLITLTALTIFGGASTRPFTLALLIGIFSGTYSSIFNASMLLVVWETGEWSRKKPASALPASRSTKRRELAGAR